MESLSLCLSSSPPFTTHKPTKTHLNSLHFRASLPTTITNSTNFNPIKSPKTPPKPPPKPPLIPLLSPLLLSPSLPCIASEFADQPPDKINLESVVIAIDDFNNRNPFFVAGVTFIWLIVIPLIKAYLRKYKYVSAIDAFRRLRDDPSAQLLDIRDGKSLAFLGSPNLKMLNKGAVQIQYSEGDEDGFVNKVVERFPDPPNTVLCIMDNFSGNSFKVAELLHKKGFKEAYAIRGGVVGKEGWQEIQESLLPPSVHIYANKKKGKKSTKGGNGAITQPIEDTIGVSTSNSEP